MNSNLYKNFALWLVIALLMVLIFNVFNSGDTVRKNISYTEFIDNVTKNDVKTVVIKQNHITGDFLSTGSQFETYAPDDTDLVPLLREHNVDIFAKPPDTTPFYMQLLMSWLPLIILVAIWIFFMRQMQGGGGKAFSFGKSKAKMLNQE